MTSSLLADASQFFQFLANGIAFGAILALAAIGLSLVYGILNLSNFAHGDFLTLGAFGVILFGRDLITNLPTLAITLSTVGLAGVAIDARWTRRLERGEQATLAAFATALLIAGLAVTFTRDPAAGTTDLTLVTATLVAIVAVSAILLGFEFAIWRPLRRRKANSLTLIIVSIGLALVVRNALQMRFSGEIQSFDRPVLPADVFFGIRFTDAQQFTLLTALALIALVHAFLRYTRAGKAMRALADNPDLARASGIDVDRMILYVWIIAGTLVTVAGILLMLLQNNTMNVNAGFTLLIALFASVIVGGIGSAYGAMLGGLIIGIAMKTSALWIGTEYELASAFLALILVLILRPQGILGVKA